MAKFAYSGLKHLPLAVAVVAALQMAPAFALEQPDAGDAPQQQAAAESDAAEGAQQLEAITVTGSLLKRPEYQTTSPVQTIEIEANMAAGAFDTADLLQSTAIAAGTTQINNQFSGFIVEGGTGVKPIDLRGLGANRSLVLLDGQRPGPSGTRGQVGAFDLNVIPNVLLQRVEIVKDGASSIYGSDAVAGVVNLITRKRMDTTEVSLYYGQPQDGGGRQVTASIGTGWNFDNGNLMFAAQYQKQAPLSLRQRDWAKCPQDMMWGADGNRVDRTDRSIIAGTPLAGCNNLYVNTIIDALTGDRYVPTTDGSTSGPFPGWHPRPSPSPRYDDGNPHGAYYEDQLNYWFTGDEWLINRNSNVSAYAAASLQFGAVNWDTQVLYNHRDTSYRGWRQFFPAVYGDYEGNLTTADDAWTIWQPIMPYPSNGNAKVDYLFAGTKLSGLIMSSDTWGWEVNATHSRSDGKYGSIGIDARRTADFQYDDIPGWQELPPVDYFDPGFLNGTRMDELISAVGIYSEGKTVYTQDTVNAVFSGDLFNLPAGGVSAAFGAEYRRYKMTDTPPPASMNDYLWGQSSADVTSGKDNVKEVFAEVGIPLITGKTGFESLSIDMSARQFKYDSVGSSDNVWKTGLSWQITPTWRLRGSLGTSYRAPGLYELYLGDQTGFLSQLSVDPCILWADSTNDFVRANCAAAGIPDDYAGAASSATVHSGGGKGFLEPETSKARTAGIVWTPDFADFNIAFDYFDYHIRGEIDTLGAGDIMFGCYGRPVYPNDFCDMFERNAPNHPTDPNKIEHIYATYININSQRTRGYDLQFNYDQDFSFGRVTADAQVTYVLEDSIKLFSSAEESGTTTEDQVGYIGRPKTVGITNLGFHRGDWSYAWQMIYNSSTQNLDLTRTVSDYFGVEAFRDIKAGWQLRHSASVTYHPDNWSIRLGVRNLFDKAPDLVSSGAATRKGNVPLVASQYDWFGRTFFANVQYEF